MQAGLRAAAMEAGVTLTDPGSVFLCADTVLAPDVTIGPNVVFGPGVTVETGAEIHAFCHLEGCHIGPDCLVGPFARLRPGAVLERAVHVGNFVELKATRMGAGAKANHLTYLGDADVGAGANIGAGTITCNYDGIAKHRTEIGAGRVHRLRHRAGRPGAGGRRRVHRRRQRDHRGRGARRAGDRARAAGAETRRRRRTACAPAPIQVEDGLLLPCSRGTGGGLQGPRAARTPHPGPPPQGGGRTVTRATFRTFPPGIEDSETCAASSA